MLKINQITLAVTVGAALTAIGVYGILSLGDSASIPVQAKDDRWRP